MAPRPRSREGLSASRVRRTAPTCGTDWKLDRRPTPSVRTDDARRTVCESLLRGETPKYWAGPEELLPRYAVGILVGQLTEGLFPDVWRR